MNESLPEVLNTSEHPCGYRFDWVARLREALEGAANGRPCYELTSVDVTQAMDCPGLWAAKQEEATGGGQSSSPSQQMLLTRQMARMWGRDAANRRIRPFQFVEDNLNDPFWMTERQSAWVAAQSFDERIELVGEISAVLCRLQDQIPFRDPSADVYVGLKWPQVEVGCRTLVADDFEVGRLTLVSDDVDFRVRTCEIDGEGAWARTVLLALVPEKPTQADLERLGFSAAMHTISTNCPPARVAAYGLLDGKLISLDVDAEWIGLQIGCIMATLRIIYRIQTGEEPPLTPGTYCANCPARRDCPFSRIGLEEF